MIWNMIVPDMGSLTGGSPMYFVAQLQDITARKRAEELKASLGDQRQAQKTEAAEIVEPGKMLAGLPHGLETLLVVEDEEAVRKLACKILQRNGYTVMEARHGIEALLICDRYDGPIHLLLTDVVMPQMSGPVLAERLAAGRPEMKVLYMSGYAHSALVHHGMLDPDTAFLQKPFTPDDMARKVRQILDGSREG